MAEMIVYTSLTFDIGVILVLFRAGRARIVALNLHFGRPQRGIWRGFSSLVDTEKLEKPVKSEKLITAVERVVAVRFRRHEGFL